MIYLRTTTVKVNSKAGKKLSANGVFYSKNEGAEIWI